MTDYTSGFDRFRIMGVLLELGAETAAKFISNDSKDPSAPELFQYGKDNVMAFPGMALIVEGKTKILKDIAQRNSEAVKAFLTFGHAHGADLYRLALENTDPGVLKDILDLMNELMPEKAFDMVNGGIFQHKHLAKIMKGASIGHVAALAEALNNYQLNKEQKDFCVEKLEEFALGAINSFSKGKYSSDPLKSAEEHRELFTQVRALFGDDVGNALIKKTLESDLIQNVVEYRSYTEKNEAHLAVLETCLSEGKRVGVDLLKVVSSEDDTGKTIFHDVVENRNVFLFEHLFKLLENEAGEEKAKEFFQGFLNTNTAMIGTDIGAVIQDVRNDYFNRDDEANKKISPIVDSVLFDNFVGSADKLSALILDCQSYVYEYLDAHKPTDDYSKEQHQELRAFADEGGPVIEGPTIVGRASGDMLEYLLGLKEKLDGLSKKDLAEAYYQDMSKPVKSCGLDATAMHGGWAGSTVLGSPGGEGAVHEGLSDFVLLLDKVFGTDVAVPLVAKLFALRDGDGRKPLENTLYDGPEGQYAKYYYPVMIKNLAVVLGDEDKLTRYMDEAIVPNLPVSFGGEPAAGAAKYLRRELGPA